MTEEELQQKRQEFRDSEVQRKIDDLGEDVAGGSNGSSKTKAVAAKKGPSSKSVPTIGWTIIITQLTGLIFFCTLFLMSYIPKTKYLVTKIMP